MTILISERHTIGYFWRHAMFHLICWLALFVLCCMLLVFQNLEANLLRFCSSLTLNFLGGARLIEYRIEGRDYWISTSSRSTLPLSWLQFNRPSYIPPTYGSVARFGTSTHTMTVWLPSTEKLYTQYRTYWNLEENLQENDQKMHKFHNWWRLQYRSSSRLECKI